MNEKKNLTAKETFALAVQNHQKNNFQVAENLYKETLKSNPNHVNAHNNLGIVLKELGENQKAISSYQKAIQLNPNHASVHSNLGLVFYELNEFEKAISCYEKAIEINPNYVNVHNNLGVVFQAFGENQKAISCYEKAIEINPNYAGAHNNLGNLFIELGNFEKAKQLLQKAIQINPNYVNAHNNLGNLFKRLREHQKAINCFQKAVEIDPNFSMAYYNLGKIFRELGKQKEAIKYFKKVDSTRSRAELLECTYFSEGLKTYLKILEKLAKKDPLNLRIASMAAYVSKKENIKNIYSFCKNPLDFVFTKNLKNELISSDKFSKNLSEILSKTELIWEPPSKTTSSGYHTLGNLLEKKDAEILILRQLIEKQVIIYKETYKSCKDYFITKWPLETKILGWHVKLIKKGYQRSHIHPDGWLSGVFYLKVPKFLDKNEGSIEFTLYGYDYPYDKNLSSFIHSPKVFDIALFPSSLFHKTIPFNSQEERHVVAFDLMPK